MSKKIVGIDIGTSSVKVVEVEKGKNINNLTNYGYFYNPDKESSFYFNSLKVDHEYIADIISTILMQSNIESRDVRMSIPVASSFSTIIQLPAIKNQKEMETAIGFEASRLIPLPLNNLRLEWSLLDHLSDDKMIKVLITAIPNDIIDKYNRIAQLLKVKNIKSEIDSVSLGRLFASPDITKSNNNEQLISNSFAVVDIGRYHTGISIVDKGIVCSHNISKISGNSFTEKIAEMMSVSKDRAYKIRNEQGFNANSQIRDCMKVILDKLIGEIAKANELYISHDGTSIKAVVLSGGLNKTPGIEDYIFKVLKIPVIQGSPFNKIFIKKELLPILEKQDVDLSVAIGLTI